MSDDATATDDFDVEYSPPASRMVIAVCALIGVMISVYTLMFKLGMLGMACGTGACETVQMSPWAVQLGIPVPVWGLAGYGAMIVLALLGLQPKFEGSVWIPRLLFAGALFALVFSIYLSWLEANKIHAWCRWCLGSAADVAVMFIAALPELRRMRRG